MSEHESALQTFSAPPNSAEIPSWKTAYEKRVAELDGEKLLTLIHAAENELFERWKTLGTVPPIRASG
jgi:hypothetical protein